MKDCRRLCFYFIYVLIWPIFIFDVSAQTQKTDNGYVFTFVEEYRFANDRRNAILNEPLRQVAKEVAVLAGIPYREVNVPSIFSVGKTIHENPNHLGFVIKSLTGDGRVLSLGTLASFSLHIYVPSDKKPPLTLKDARAMKRIGVWESPRTYEFAQKYQLDLVPISHWTGATTLKLRKVNGFMANPFMMINRWLYLGYGDLPQKGVQLNSIPLFLAIHPDPDHPDFSKIQSAYETILASGKYAFLEHLINNPEQYIQNGKIQF